MHEIDITKKMHEIDNMSFRLINQKKKTIMEGAQLHKPHIAGTYSETVLMQHNLPLSLMHAFTKRISHWKHQQLI